MPKLVTIFGGSGFVGRYIARRMAKAGWRVRVAVRRPNEAIFVRTYGVVGQVEPVFANIRDDASTLAALRGADAVVNCVGTFDKWGKNNFDAVQTEAAGRIAKLSAKEGVSRLVHISALGADKNSESLYQQTKAAGEKAIKKYFPSAVILRPSVIFGNEDQFFNRFASMAKMMPILPLVGADTKFQPVYVDDVAAAAEAGINGASAGIYELGGPDIASFKELMEKMLHITRRKRFVVNMPNFMAKIMAFILDLLGRISLGLFTNEILTGDQIKSLAYDNVVGAKAKGFKALGITPTDMDAVLPEYLYAHRPKGQFTELAESAKGLKT